MYAQKYNLSHIDGINLNELITAQKDNDANMNTENISNITVN